MRGLPDLGIEPQEKKAVMKNKAKIKVVLDVIMTAMLIAQMAYHVAGDKVHEITGSLLLLLFITHNILNRNWYKGLLKGKYGAARIIRTIINFLLAISMLGMIVSGIMLSPLSYLLSFRSGMLGRRLHMLSTAWGFILVSAHLGLHWGKVAGMITRLTRGRIPPLILRLAALGIASYGVYAFFIRQFGQKMFLLIDYAFFDYEEPAIFFFIDYIAVMGLFVCVGYYAVKLAQKKRSWEISPDLD
jgi:hypothetical protein